jgi:hypothetical protein
MEKGAIEIAPLAYMRGRTLNDSFIILDEAQNSTAEQMKMFLTRLGFNSKMVITGDVTQVDLPASRGSGLIEVQSVPRGVPGIRFVFFDDGDVVRHQLVSAIVPRLRCPRRPQGRARLGADTVVRHPDGGSRNLIWQRRSQQSASRPGLPDAAGAVRGARADGGGAPSRPRRRAGRGRRGHQAVESASSWRPIGVRTFWRIRSKLRGRARWSVRSSSRPTPRGVRRAASACR